MKKAIVVLSCLALVLMASLALAVPSGKAAFNGLNHRGKASQLMLYEKDADWNVVEDGAWGRMTFSDEFVFNGHGLDAVEYCLINYAPETNWLEDSYPNPWPGDTSTLMAQGTPNNGGNLHLTGSMEGVTGKVWLVLCGDFVEETGMTDWNPSEYLFEYNLI